MFCFVNDLDDCFVNGILPFDVYTHILQVLSNTLTFVPISFSPMRYARFEGKTRPSRAFEYRADLEPLGKLESYVFGKSAALKLSILDDILRSTGNALRATKKRLHCVVGSVQFYIYAPSKASSGATDRLGLGRTQGTRMRGLSMIM